MKKKFFYVAVLLFLLFVFVGCKKDGNDSLGTITVIVINYEAEEVFNGEIDFFEEDTLLELLKSHEEILLEVKESSFGLYVFKVCNISDEDFPNTYWSIEVNGEYSMVGIAEIPLKDKDEIKLSLIGY